MEEELLVPEKMYREYAVHLGVRKHRAYEMRRFIHKIRKDGVAYLDIRAIDQRIRVASKMLARYDPEEVLIVGARPLAKKPIEKCAEVTGFKAVTGRFFPGTLTNPNAPTYMEPELIFVNDPFLDRQAIKEAVEIGIPIIALCDTHNQPRYVDLIVPANNRGRKSLGFLYWIISREVLKARGEIKTDEEFKYTIEDFFPTLYRILN